MKIYYAHHVWKYDTPIENFEIKCIERQFKDAVIVNPRTTIPQDQPESVILATLPDWLDMEYSMKLSMLLMPERKYINLTELNVLKLEVIQILLSMGFVILYSVAITECTLL